MVDINKKYKQKNLVFKASYLSKKEYKGFKYKGTL